MKVQSKLQKAGYFLKHGTSLRKAAHDVQYTNISGTRKMKDTPTHTLLDLGKRHPKYRDPPRGSPAHMQQRAIDRELKHRYPELQHEEVSSMTKLISLVEQKNAEGFRSAVEASLAEKVADVLDGLKPIVAQNFFAKISEDAEGSESGELSDKEENLSNTSEPGPGKGQGSNQKGGFSAGDVKAQPMPGTQLATDVKLPGQGDHPQKTLASESKWIQKAVHKSRAGMFAGRSLSSIEKEKSNIEGTKKATRTKMGQLNFAIRAKENHGFKK